MKVRVNATFLARAMKEILSRQPDLAEKHDPNLFIEITGEHKVVYWDRRGRHELWSLCPQQRVQAYDERYKAAGGLHISLQKIVDNRLIIAVSEDAAITPPY